jgi:uncharacterized membrane protein
MHEILLIIHFIGLAMGLGTSFGFMFLGMVSSKMEKSEGQKFMLNAFGLSKMGHVGITLLVVSGLFLMGPYWRTLTATPLLMAKLVMVLVLAALIGIMSSKAKKARQGDAQENMKKIAPLGRISLLVGLTIVVLAVLVFN